jgi:hypothetical protein
MASESSVKVSVDVATEAATKALNGLKDTTKSVSTAFDVFQGSLAGGLAVRAIEGLVSGISNSFGRMIDEAGKSQAAINQLNVALEQSGQFSANTSKDLQDFAGALQNTTKYGDDAVMASSSLLLSLTNLSTDGVKQATVAAADFATTLNIDLATATDYIQKAINGNTTALKKMGIEVQSGSTDSERLANTLKALASQQGAASKATNTFEGASAQLANAQGDVIKNLGKLITENPLVVAGMQTLIKTFGSLSDFIVNNKQLFYDLGTTIAITTGIVAAAVVGYGAFIIATGGATAAMGFLSIAATAAWAAVTGPIGLAAIAIAAIGVAVYGVIKYWDDLKIAAAEAGAVALDVAAKFVYVATLSKDAEAAVQNQAQSLRDYAQATREAQAAAVAEGDAVKKAEADKAAAKDAANELGRLQKEKAERAKFNAEQLATAQTQSASLNQVEQERQLGLLTIEQDHNAAMLQAKGEFYTSDLENQLAAQMDSLLAKQDLETQALQIQTDAAIAKAQLEEDDAARTKALRDATNKSALENLKLQSKQEIDVKKLQAKTEQTLAAQAITDRTNTLNTFAALATSNNQTLAAIGKAAGLTQIAIATPPAVASATAFGTATGGPVLGAVFAGITYAAMAAQAAQLVGVNFADGGIVPGTSYQGDRVAANLNSGEMILNKGQQAQLFKMANGAQPTQDNSQTNSLLVQLIDAVRSKAVVQIDDRAIINVLRDGVSAGRSFA